MPKRPILLRVDNADQADSVANALAETRSRGFDGIELVWQQAGRRAVEPRPGDGVNLAVSFACRSTDPAAGRREIAAMIETAAACGADLLNLTPPPVERPAGGSGFTRYQDAMNFAFQSLYDLRHDAESAGVTLTLEAAAGGCFQSPVEVRELIDRVNSPAVGACVDVDRVSRIGIAADWVATLGFRCKAVRVGTPDADDPDALAAALDAIRYGGPVILGSGVALDGGSVLLGRFTGMLR